MAILNQSYFQEGKTINGSPEGLEYGEFGNKIYDIQNDSVYESLGGVKWKLIKKDGKSLQSTHMNLVSELDTDANLVVGDVLYEKSRPNPLKVIADKKKYLILEHNGVTYSKLECKDSPVIGVLPVGTKIELDIFIKSRLAYAGSPVLVFAFNNVAESVQLYTASRPYDYSSFISTKSQLGNFSAHDMDGNPINNKVIPIRKWVRCSFEIVEEGYSINDFTVSWGSVIFENASYKISRVSIDNGTVKDIWDFTLNGNSLTSTLGSTLVEKNPEPTRFGVEEASDYSEDLFQDLINEKLLHVRPVNNIITPQDLGYVSEEKYDSTLDAYPYIQACLDSPYAVYIPGGNYYISKGLSINRPQSIRLEGSFVLNERYTDNEKDWGTNKSVSRIWTDQNIHLVTANSPGIKWDGGFVDGSQIIDHTRALYRLQVSARMWGLSFTNIWGRGNKDDMSVKPGIGAIGLYYDIESNQFENCTRTVVSGKYETLTFPVGSDLNAYGIEVGMRLYAIETVDKYNTYEVISIDNVAKTMEVWNVAGTVSATTDLIVSEVNPKGYIYEGIFTGFLENCAYGILDRVNPSFPVSHTNNYHQFSMIRCKQYLYVESNSQSKYVKMMFQEGAVLPEAEKDLYAATILSSGNYLDMSCVDRNKATSAPWDHSQNQFYIAKGNELSWNMLTRYVYTDSKIFSNNQEGLIVNDPLQLNLSNAPTNHIAAIDNAMSNAYVRDGYSEGGYVAPDLAWFDTHLNDAITEGLTPANPSTEIELNINGLFNGGKGKSFANYKAQYSFAEFVLPSESTDDYISFLGSVNSNTQDMLVQIIAFNSVGVIGSYMIENPIGSKTLISKSFSNWDNVIKIIVRVIATESTIGLTWFNSLSFKQERGDFSLSIDKTNKVHEFPGIMKCTKQGISIPNSLSNPRSYIETSSNYTLVSNDFTDIIFINNTHTGSIVLGLARTILQNQIGRTITLILTSDALGHAGMVDSQNIIIVDSSSQMVSTAPSNTTLVAGDWIRFLILGIDTSGNSTYGSWLEIGRGKMIY